MDRPTQVVDGLIHLEAVCPALGRTNAIVLNLQAPHASHAGRGHGVTVNIPMLQGRDHPLAGLLQAGEDLPGLLPSFGLERQRREGLPGFLCVPAIAAEGPDALQNGP